jgi:L-ascorbate metabolism protein UlaG (beta-lactamase superfamily)
MINIKGKILINLTDTLFQNEWEELKPDVLMLPIGGLGNNIWTLDVPDAIKTVKLMTPKIVIPCHYNVPFLFKRNAAPANENLFKGKVEKLGVRCEIMKSGSEILI